MCWTVTSRVASFTFPTTSSSQPIAGAAGTLRCAAARAVGGIAVKQAASIAFDDSRHTRASAGRRILFPAGAGATSESMFALMARGVARSMSSFGASSSTGWSRDLEVPRG